VYGCILCYILPRRIQYTTTIITTNIPIRMYTYYMHNNNNYTYVLRCLLLVPISRTLRAHGSQVPHVCIICTYNNILYYYCCTLPGLVTFSSRNSAHTIVPVTHDSNATAAETREYTYRGSKHTYYRYIRIIWVYIHDGK